MTDAFFSNSPRERGSRRAWWGISPDDADARLNPAQRQAVHAPLQPLLIVAGAGTGKTRTLMSRFLHLLASGVHPGHISAITFTNKAAQEMADRVAQSRWHMAYSNPGYTLSALRHGPFIGTFHSLGAKILRSDASRLSRSGNFVIFDDDDSMQLIRRILKFQGREAVKRGPAHFRDVISRLKAGTSSASEFTASSRPDDHLALEIFGAYERALQEQNAFDFDDLIQKVVVLFEAHPEVLAKYRHRFAHVLIDEYQDLNNAQYRLVKLMTTHAKSFSAVGDDAQMIYGWRGSNIEIFLNFPRDWPDHATVFLEENYRSTANIIAAASGVIRENLSQPLAWPRKKLWTKSPSGAPVKVIEAADEKGEAERIAEEILKKESLHPKETIAILYRTNAQSRAVEQALLRAGISYRIFGGLKFYERREIKDILAGVRHAVNPQDELSRLRLEKTLVKSAFSELRSRIEERTWQTPTDLVRLFLEATDYFAYLERNFTNAAERQENVAALLDFSRDFRDPQAFLDQVSLLQAIDTPAYGHAFPSERSREARRNAHRIERRAIGDSRFTVSLMTIHLAKGLEFDTVFLAGAGEGVLPHARAFDSEKELEEERRLMYVAMTRAKQNLVISFYDLPSRYLADVPAETYEFESAVPGNRNVLHDEERYITLD